jgi:hypothetical protein
MSKLAENISMANISWYLWRKLPADYVAAS